MTASNAPSGTTDPEITVTDNAGERRYELKVGQAVVGVAAYGLGDSVITFTHTKIDPGLEGRGLGSFLAEWVLTDARRRRLSVVPECPFIAAYIARHPEFADLVAADD